MRMLPVSDNDQRFGIIFGIDEGDDWTSELALIKANPNFGVSISARNFKTTADAARVDPTAQPHFFATRLGWWTRAASAWMDLDGMVVEEFVPKRTDVMASLKQGVMICDV